METSFDPVVSMMLNALSYELEKIAHELEDSKTRVVEDAVNHPLNPLTSDLAKIAVKDVATRILDIWKTGYLKEQITLEHFINNFYAYIKVK